MINFICIFLNERWKDKPKDYLRLHDYGLILLLHDLFYMASGKAKDTGMKKRSVFARDWVGKEFDYKIALLRLSCNLIKLLPRISVTIPMNSYSMESFWKMLV